MQMRNTQNKDFIKQQEFFGANMASCDMILGFPWLIVSKTYVEWETGEFYFFSDISFALLVRETPAKRATKVSTPDPDIIKVVAD